jgi:hypothetical protein
MSQSNVGKGSSAEVSSDDERQALQFPIGDLNEFQSRAQAAMEDEVGNVSPHTALLSRGDVRQCSCETFGTAPNANAAGEEARAIHRSS